MILVHPNGVNTVNVDTPNLIAKYKRHGYREKQSVTAEVIAHKELHFVKPELPKKVADLIDEIDNYVEVNSNELDKELEPLIDLQTEVVKEVKEKPKQTRKKRK